MKQMNFKIDDLTSELLEYLNNELFPEGNNNKSKIIRLAIVELAKKELGDSIVNSIYLDHFNTRVKD